MQFISEGCKVLTGWDVEDFLGNRRLSWSEVIHPEDRDRLWHEVQGALSTRAIFQLTYRIQTQDGATRWVFERGHGLYNETGALLGLEGFITGVEEGHEGDVVTGESERRFRQILENIRLFAVSLDRHACVTFCNDHALEVIGWTRQEMLGKDWFAKVSPPHLDCAEIFRRAIATGAMPSYHESEILTRGGQLRHIAWNIAAIRDPEGKILAVNNIGEDITERVLARRALEESERRFRAVFELVNDAIFVQDAVTGAILDVNERMCALYGITREQALCCDIIQLSSGEPPYSWAEVRHWWNKAASEGPQLFEWRARRHDGQLFWVEVNLCHARLGNEERMFASVRDISTRKETEHRARRLNRLYSVSSSINDAIVRLREPQELYDSACQIAVEQGGFQMAWVGLLNEESRQIVPVAQSGDHQDYLKNLRLSLLGDRDQRGPGVRAFISGQPAVSNNIAGDSNFLYRQEATASGFRSCAVFPLLITGRSAGILAIYAGQTQFFDQEEMQVLNSLAENLSFAIETAQRRKEREHALAALAENQRMLSTLLSNLPGMAFRCRNDEHWTLEFVSEGCRVLTGYRPDELILSRVRSFNDIMHPEDRDEVRATIEKALREDRMYEAHYRLLTASGEEKWVWERGQEVSLSEGGIPLIEGFVTDITERKKLEAQFLRAQRMESIGTLAGGVAHDLNNIFAPILMSMELLRPVLPADEDQRLLDGVEQSASRGADLVKQILTFARGVEGKRLPLKAVDLIGEINRLVRDTFPKTLDLHLSVPPNLWLIHGDPTQLHQVLLNLAVNARDAMSGDGQLSIVARNETLGEVDVSGHPGAVPGAYLVFEVSDTGTGIPEHVRERMFEPFFTTKEQGKGTGLGLSTTHAIVRSHAGFIDVLSAMGVGTTFRVYLPADPDGSLQTEVTGHSTIPPSRGETVLLIDDEAAVRMTTTRILTSAGYKVHAARNGVEAIGLFTQHGGQFHIVLTDMMMPNMDGPSAIKALQRLRPGLPVVAMTGLAADRRLAQATEAGVKHVLMKPFTRDALLRTLRQALDGEDPE